MKAALKRHLPLIITAVIFALLFSVAGWRYDNFFSLANFLNLFTNNASVGIIAVGMTLVIFAGGIDLSVGSVLGFTTIFFATMVEGHGVHPVVAALAALAIGTIFGAVQGLIIHVFRQPPFLVTLAGMFFARGCAFWVSTESIDIHQPFFRQLTSFEIPLGPDATVKAATLMVLAVLALGFVVAHHTRFGRNLLAIGGNEQSAVLMGLPVGATKIAAYALCGGLAALAGLASCLYAGAGDSASGAGKELDAIAVVVIGGTLLTGGRGHIFGTLCGLLIFGTINAAISFDGRLDPAWSRIIIGLLLLGFILFQRLLLRATQNKLA
jgi:simple sugar transport system permease protein